MIVPVYAALLAALFVLLSVNTIRTRRSLSIPVGHADSEQMLRAMRVHANFAEYVPFTLLLAYMLEAQGANMWLLHSIGGVLLLGRCLHAYGVGIVNEDYRFRVTGMALTFTALGLAAVGLLVTAVL